MSYPRYISHKEVGAAKITGVDRSADGGLVVHLEGFQTVKFSQQEKANKPIPETGWYLVQYDEGYMSFSPPKVFETGYTRLEDPGPNASAETNAAHVAKLAEAANVPEPGAGGGSSSMYTDDSADEAAALAGADKSPEPVS